MKKTVALFLSAFILFNLAGCNTNTATPELESTSKAEQTPYNTPLQPTEGPTSNPEETSEEFPTPSPSILETPSGHYANGVAYYSVEENPQLIYDPYYIVGYHGYILPLNTSFNSILEGASDASELSPRSLPVIRLQSYDFTDKITHQTYYTERTEQETEIIRPIVIQKVLETNQFTGLNLTEDMITFSDKSVSFHYQRGTTTLSVDNDSGLSFSFINSDLYNAIREDASGDVFMNKVKDQQYISGIIQYAGYQNPVCKRTINYNQTTPISVYYIYDETEDPVQNSIHQNLNYIRITTSNNDLNRIYIDINQLNYDQYTSKNFEAISYEEARQALLNGKYYTSAPLNEFPEEDIEYVELVFTKEFSDKYYIPTYLFYINLHDYPNKNHYGLYYIPAITGLDFQSLDTPPGHRNID